MSETRKDLAETKIIIKPAKNSLLIRDAIISQLKIIEELPASAHEVKLEFLELVRKLHAINPTEDAVLARVAKIYVDIALPHKNISLLQEQLLWLTTPIACKLLKTAIAKIQPATCAIPESESRDARFQDFFMNTLFPKSGKNIITDFEAMNGYVFASEFQWFRSLNLELNKVKATLHIRSSVVALGVGVYLNNLKVHKPVHDIDFFLQYQDIFHLEDVQTVLLQFGFKEKSANIGTSTFYKSFTVERLAANGSKCNFDMTCISPNYQSTNLSILKSAEMHLATKEELKAINPNLFFIIQLQPETYAVISDRPALTQAFKTKIFESNIPDVKNALQIQDPYIKGLFQRTFKDRDWALQTLRFTATGYNANLIMYSYKWIYNFLRNRKESINLNKSCYYEMVDLIRAGYLQDGKAIIHMQAFLAATIDAHFTKYQGGAQLIDNFAERHALAMLPFLQKAFENSVGLPREIICEKLFFAVKFLMEQLLRTVPEKYAFVFQDVLNPEYLFYNFYLDTYKKMASIQPTPDLTPQTILSFLERSHEQEFLMLDKLCFNITSKPLKKGNSRLFQYIPIGTQFHKKEPRVSAENFLTLKFK
jgi:hypothetical protein